MADGILKYLEEKHQTPKDLWGTDIQDRHYKNDKWSCEYGLDFLSDDYPIDTADIVIMNPPYSTLEPFLIRALEIAKDKLIVLCRMQALEGESRYKEIFIKNPPTAVYQYVDRIQCWKNGEEPKSSGSQAYCWLIWDKSTYENFNNNEPPRLYWLRRSKKQ